MSDGACPVCGSAEDSAARDVGFGTEIHCPNCGTFVLASSAESTLLAGTYRSENGRAKIAYAIRQRPTGSTVTSTNLANWVSDVQLPSPTQMLDNAVIYMATRVRLGTIVGVEHHALRATVGATDIDGVSWAFSEAATLGWLRSYGGAAYALSSDGWRRFEEMQRAGTDSRRAFLALKFGDDELDRMVATCLRPAVAKTGFELRAANDDHQQAGSIHDQIRVDIRLSRFVICDLSHGNRGAYWEAGFAHGLGRHVFYTCRHDVLLDKTHVNHPHFDTANALIVPWHPDNLAPFEAKLKASIRATFPDATPVDPTN